MAEEKLKSCPFCGKKASLVGKHIQFVQCGTCGARGQSFDGHPTDCITAWNTCSK